MKRKFIVTLLAATFATTAVVDWFPARPLAANGSAPDALADTDGDFLPDTVEWTVMTNANNADTDGDERPDFVEIVEAGHPRLESPALPIDQQMRVVITGAAPGETEDLTWMHVMIRVVDVENAVPGASTGIESFAIWLELGAFPGVAFPLDVLGAALHFEMRTTAHHGVWIRLSFPLASEGLLSSLLPCTLYAESTIDGQQLASGMKLLDVQGDIATLVPYGDGRFVMQAISAATFAVGTGSTQSNRVCVLELDEVGSGPGGTVYEVTGADCEDANELECAASCPSSVGWLLTIPGGTSLLGGN